MGKKKRGSQNLLLGLIVALMSMLLAGLGSGNEAYSKAADHFGPCDITESEIDLSGSPVSLFYPASESCTSAIEAPYPAVAFAHGFSFFGFADGRNTNSGNGRLLASWGYVVAIPTLDDDPQLRLDTLAAAVDFLAFETANPSSIIAGLVDINRLGTAGYSLGGTTSMMLAKQDERIKTVFALDPVYDAGGPGGDEPIWDIDLDAPTVTAPVGMIGAEASICNSEGDYADLYAKLGSHHKGAYHLVGASHCALADPGDQFCNFVCGDEVSEEMTQLAQTYMRSWFDYYLRLDGDMYSQLYGAKSEADVSAGLITKMVDTKTDNLAATGQISQVQLQWDQVWYDVLGGYSIERRQIDQDYPPTPLAIIPNGSTFIDTTAASGVTYAYQIRAIDRMGNRFQLTDEVQTASLSDPKEPRPTETPLPPSGEERLLFLPMLQND